MSIETREVLAGAYLHHEGREGKSQVHLTHALDTDYNETLCRRIDDPESRLADPYSQNVNAPPTCTLCLKRDARFGGKYKRRERAHKVWTEEMDDAALAEFHAARGPRDRKKALKRLANGRAGY